MKKIDFSKIEKKWQKLWKEKKIFQVKENPKKKKYYCLEQYPYPSGSGLHMGHAFIYTIGDIYARFKRMHGFNVLHPIGFDSFGLPAENAAIKANSNPKIFTENAIKNFRKLMRQFGFSYDWNREIQCHKPDYYKWDQWIFLKMYEKGLAYRKKAPVNWCPKCNTVLANEQVHNGKCWRHEDTSVEIKNLNQWFLKITKYAEELLSHLDKLPNYPELIKILQKNWIGKSQGLEINFEINGKNWPVFTTRPDTIFGVTFMVISSQHPHLFDLVTKKHEKEVRTFLGKIKSTSEEDIEKLEKEGVFTGSYAINPLTKEEVPIYAGNFVLADYGSGMVMAVPAHDQRDFEFAKKYALHIKQVIKPETQKELSEAYLGAGKLINSAQFTGLSNEEGKDKISEYIEKNKLGKRQINYKLRDWLISRQRYWGTPIPIIYCEKCGIVPVPEKSLPVKLPEKVEFGKGNPLETNSEFLNTTCPKCKSKAKRETDTMDTFVNSSWYFLRYCDSKNANAIFDTKKADYWMPIDIYIGGKEHATMHDIYFRFYTKFLKDLSLLKLDEPAVKLFAQGFVYGKDGRKMSKSYGNVIIPEEVAGKYGADATRLFLVSVASPEKDINWSDEGIESSWRFLNRIFNFISSIKPSSSSQRLQHKMNKAIKEISEEIESLRYNLAIIKLRILFEEIEEEHKISRKDLESFLKLLSIFCPHVSEELWHNLKNKSFISLEKWPKADEKKINEKLEQQEKAQEKMMGDIKNILNIVKEKQNKETKTIYIYAIPNEIKTYNSEYISKKLNKEVKVFAVNDKDKYDPQNKASKAKPGKPGIYVE